ncbi:MAG: type II secretion system protein N, partial [Comamonadaceae bacterium]
MKRHNLRPLTTPWRWAAAGALLGLLMALAVFAPARWLAAAVLSASRGQVQLADARGTVWRGDARLLLSGGEGSRDAVALPGAVQWRLGLSGLGVAGEVTADCCTSAPLRWRLSPQWGGASLAWADGQSQWPAALLAGLGTPWNSLAPQGNLQLATRGLVIDWNAGRMTLAGQARL